MKQMISQGCPSNRFYFITGTDIEKFVDYLSDINKIRICRLLRLRNTYRFASAVCGNFQFVFRFWFMLIFKKVFGSGLYL